MDTKKTPLAVAVYAEIIWIICLLFVALFPGFSKTIFQSWFHGVNLVSVWNVTITFSSVILGLVSIFVVTYILVWLFVALYKAIVK